MKLLILQGLPASGKTTWAKKYVEEHKDWVRVNRDDLRHMRGVYWLPKQEGVITAWEDSCIISALSKGLNVVLDATNLNKDRNKAKINALKVDFPDLKVEIKFFDVPVEECIRRDYLRANGVGKEVIMDMYNKYLKPNPIIYRENRELPSCIICDIDGTLAHAVSRGPFDWLKVKSDIVDTTIADLLDKLSIDTEIILFSGRDGSCKELTEEWLLEYEIPYKELHMRPAGNTLKDSIIKKQLFEEHIRGKYYCEFVLDDRDQVVRMWREELGLKCLQVNYGNF